MSERIFDDRSRLPAHAFALLQFTLLTIKNHERRTHARSEIREAVREGMIASDLRAAVGRRHRYVVEAGAEKVVGRVVAVDEENVSVRVTSGVVAEVPIATITGVRRRRSSGSR